MGEINDFHAHLDKCSQCANQPFNLCSTGKELLKKAAGGEDEVIVEKGSACGPTWAN